MLVMYQMLKAPWLKTFFKRSRGSLVNLVPYSSLGYPWENSWSTTGSGYEMSHGFYSKPDLNAILPSMIFHPGQPWFGPGIAIWYQPSKAVQDQVPNIPMTHPCIYGVGWTSVTCSVIMKETHELDIFGPDIDNDGTPDFIDPTPTMTTPGYSARDYIGPAGTWTTNHMILVY